MIGPNSSIDWARESMKASSDSEDSNESCEVRCAHWWCYSDVVLWKILVFTLTRKMSCYQSQRLRAQTKNLGNKLSTKNVRKDLSFAILTKSIEIFCWGIKSTKSKDTYFCRSSNFCASQHSRTASKLQNRCVRVSYNILPNFREKYWQINILLEENQKIR